MFEEKLRLYESQTEVSAHFTESMKRTHLENTVQPVAELAAMKIQSDQIKTQTRFTQTYDQYVMLLNSAAYSGDARNLASRTHGSTNAGKRSVYHSSTESEPQYDSDTQYGIDFDCHTLLAHKSMLTPMTQQLNVPQDLSCPSINGKH
jgi:hypothetical protein